MAKTRTRQPDGAFANNPWILTGAAAAVAIVAVTAALLNTAARRAIRRARSFVGQHEITPNAGFEDRDFQERMTKAGWYNGAQWCAFFVRMILLSLGREGSKSYEFWKKAINGNTQVTWNNLQTPSKYHEVSRIPIANSLIIYQGIDDPSHGHIEFVDKVNADGSYMVISGNDVFPDGSGQGVVRKERPRGGIAKYRILGYIKIKKV